MHGGPHIPGVDDHGGHPAIAQALFDQARKLTHVSNLYYNELQGRLAQRLVELIGALGISPRALLREKGTPYAELGLADPKWSDDELIDFMLAHPILINRPIVVTPKGVRLCRPSELVLDLLDKPVQSFVKEDGEAVTRAKG